MSYENINVYGIWVSCTIIYTTRNIEQKVIKNEYSGWPISNETERKLNISITARRNGIIFFTKDRGMFTHQIHTDKVSENLC